MAQRVLRIQVTATITHEVEEGTEAPSEAPGVDDLVLSVPEGEAVVDGVELLDSFDR